MADYNIIIPVISIEFIVSMRIMVVDDATKLDVRTRSV